ncbi:unnamed protein product, partial [marine sediment metagenome]
FKSRIKLKIKQKTREQKSPKIPEQKASPNRVTKKMTLSLNQQRIEKYKEKLGIKN